MSPAEVESLLDRLAPTLATLDHGWVVIGSAALAIAGAPVDCSDVDILTTTAGAETLEFRWARWRQWDLKPPAVTPFRSRFSRYVMEGDSFEVMGDLFCRKAEGWRTVAVDEIEWRVFGSHAWPIPSLSEQMRLLRLFDRPKDLRRIAMVEAWAPQRLSSADKSIKGRAF